MTAPVLAHDSQVADGIGFAVAVGTELVRRVKDTNLQLRTSTPFPSNWLIWLRRLRRHRDVRIYKIIKGRTKYNGWSLRAMSSATLSKGGTS